jgi:hypothetical protein
MSLKFQTIYDDQAVQIFMIESIKTPLMEGVETIFDSNASKVSKLKAISKIGKALMAVDKLPRPTKENTWHPNAHNLIDIRDWIESCLELAGIRMGFIDRVFNIAIIIYNFDPPWRYIMDSCKEKSDELTWKPRGWEDDWEYPWFKEKPFPPEK